MNTDYTTIYDVKHHIEQLSHLIRENIDVVDRFDIGYGCCGFALFYYQKYQLYHLEKDLHTFYEMTERAIQQANHPVENGFTYIDFTELGFFLHQHQHLLKPAFDITDLLSSVDELLLDYATYAIRENRLDPYTGGFLQAHYFLLQGTHTPFINSIIEDLYTGKLDLAKGGISQTGITHGLAFFLLFFVRCYEQDIAREKSRRLMQQTASTLLTQAQDIQNFGTFFCDQIGANGPSGLNLCYGDAGIIYALLRAAEHLPAILSPEKTTHMIHHLAERTSQIKQVTPDSIMYGHSGFSFYYEHLHRSGLFSSTLSENPAAYEGLLSPPPECFMGYGQREKKKISLLEGATGLAYLYCCRHTRNNPDLINALTYLL